MGVGRHEEQGPNVGGTIESATERLAECNAAFLRKAASAADTMKLVYRFEDGYAVGFTGDGDAVVLHRDDVGKIPTDRRHFSIAVLFKCLPDTVDPRGPKGK